MEAAEKKESKATNDQALSDNVTKKPDVPEDFKITINLEMNNLIQGYIMSEILGHPRALRSRGNGTWISRF